MTIHSTVNCKKLIIFLSDVLIKTLSFNPGEQEPSVEQLANSRCCVIELCLPQICTTTGSGPSADNPSLKIEC